MSSTRPRSIFILTSAVVVGLALRADAQSRFEMLWRLPGWPGGQVLGPAGYVQVCELDADAFADALLAHGDVSYNHRRSGFRSWQSLGQVLGLTIQSAVGDVDGDGDDDLMITGIALTPTLGRLLLNDGSGSFIDVSSTHLPPYQIDSIASLFSDVDGDRDLDLVVGAMVSQRQPAPQRGSIFINDGTGHFIHDSQRASLPFDTTWDLRLAAADLDGDGDQDLVAARTAGPCRVFLNDGAGQFTFGPPLPPISARIVRAGDLDGDGDVDLGFFGEVQAYARPTICINDGTAHFTDGTPQIPFLALGSLYGGGAFADIDEDGDIDIVVPLYPFPVTATESAFLQQLVNDGAGHFTDATLGWMPTSPGYLYECGWIQAADFDRDGDVDLIGNDAGAAYPQRQPAVFWNMTRQLYAPQPARIGQPWDLEFHAEPGTLVLPLAAFRPGFVDLGAIGAFGLDPTAAIAGPALVVPTGRSTTWTLQVPNDPSLVGVHLYWQCAFVDTAPLSVRLSNTFDETFGT